jgi:hypothetical protein
MLPAMEPAQTIIQKFGGPSALAKLLGIHRTRVSNWQRPRESGGTGGVVPQRHHRQLLGVANERGIDLKAEDFLLPPIAHDGGDERAPDTAEPEAVQ